MTSIEFQQSLLAWYDDHGRKNLPWQSKPPNPYAIWVSEIMLQQTQVSVVIPYFERFLHQFPDIQALADASQDLVLTCWAGLGYYARARNLHRAAQIICTQFQGQFPTRHDQLCQLPGIGRSTASAILSMAFSQHHAILDGNVKRVLARYFAIEGWPGQSAISRQLWQYSEELTPEHRVAEYTQAIMDLGATLCTRRRPDCEKCPVATGCKAKSLELTEQLPTPRKQRSLPVKSCYMPVLLHQDYGVLLEKRPDPGIWGGLWSLPEFTDKTSLINWFQQRGIQASTLRWLGNRKHTFSHYHLQYQPVIGLSGHTNFIQESDRADWFNISTAEPAMPAPIRKLLDEIFPDDVIAQNSTG
ncbi:MAG: A/G-specific adenine glycosylase [Gammaproteobacteria bacterium]|nr:A/G-specific adenine glycosylase [Gammaproteobacteria bacterium]